MSLLACIDVCCFWKIGGLCVSVFVGVFGLIELDCGDVE